MLTKNISRSNIKNKSALFDSSSVGINQIRVNFDGVKVYPNPAKEKIISSNLNENFTFEVEVINCLGECVQSTKISGISMKEISLKEHPSGLYLIHVKSKTNHKSYKIQLK